MKSGFICVFAGLIFFFNPAFNLFDILPDFLGCALICLGLKRLSEIDEDFKSARKCAFYLAWISVARLLLSVWVNAGYRSDYLLPLTFAFGVLEVIFLISFFKNLYTGFDYNAMRLGCEELRVPASGAFTMSAIFAVVTRILEFAPQITEIFKQESELDLSYDAYRKIPISAVRQYITAACLVCSLILGILFLISTVKFFAKLIKNRELSNALEKRYESEFLSDRELVVSRTLPRIYILIEAGLLFLYDFSIDGINVLPDFVGVFLLCLALSSLCKLNADEKFPRFLCALSLIFSIADYAFTTFINLGIDRIFRTGSELEGSFAFIESPLSAAVGTLICAANGILIFVLLFSAYVEMKKVFRAEKRSAGVGMTSVLKFFAALVCLAGAVYNSLRAVTAHLASNTVVREFILTKSLLTKEADYLQALENPLILRFERLDSVCFYTGIAFCVTVVISIIYLSRAKSVTEGDER